MVTPYAAAVELTGAEIGLVAQALDPIYQPEIIRAGCGGEYTVPLITTLEARYIADAVRERFRAGRVFDACVDWLRLPVPGVRSLERIRGRPYRIEEGPVILGDLALVAETTCPFWTTGSCLLGSYAPPDCSGGSRASLYPLFRLLPKPLRWLSWMPALLAQELDRTKAQEIFDQGGVADAKLALQRFQIF